MSKAMGFVKELGSEFKKDKATTLAAAQAYYYLLAIVPLLILLLAILPYLQIDPQKAVDFIGTILPGEVATTFQDTIVSVVTTPSGGLLTFGILGTLWSASNALTAFIDATNQAYGVEESRSFIKLKATAIVLTLGMLVAVIVALILPIFGGTIIDMIKSFLNLPEQTEIIFQVLRWVVSIAVMSIVLALMYKFAPDKHFPFKEVIIGAVIATVLWQVVSFGFSIYVANFGSYSATYGSLGGLIVLMLWFFLTGLILVIGAEINAILHRRKNAKGADSSDPVAQSEANQKEAKDTESSMNKY
ncbi:YihY/virulence factor BrkB family protein [Microbacterium sp. APC 3898]|jgi:membrane protein|uniref:YihY/virulence factor BrkB family protein n=2 Tax=Planococcus TaxID=1372 RepID=A0ABT7ZKL0_9BACL|nr:MULTISPECIES: YihY/virulence factor BrkB family protein [Terrabacteria group]MBD8014813.1 YihY/virulence factor BrkB family protein [Planococcus wigleyi]MDN3427699.1 YihY/virulence factor BrkB family protein [Planococcus sp. APC 4016]MDN3437054.1 YihY/virulence factor BrkB family protein [Planococcus sp. APC 3900]MDN3499251.1 YihY/virulence factor BrkB family protein [Microbacterium sp. APC 3898]